MLAVSLSVLYHELFLASSSVSQLCFEGVLPPTPFLGSFQSSFLWFSSFGKMSSGVVHPVFDLFTSTASHGGSAASLGDGVGI